MSTSALTAVPATFGRTSERLERMLDEHHDLVWRTLRRLGVPEPDVADAAQHVILVLHRKLDQVPPEAERSFLYSIVLRVAAAERRAHARRRDVLGVEVEEPADEAPSAEALLDEKQARAALDRILQAMPDELRTVFVLYELEELPAIEISELLAIPPGTVASRLRRARELFQAATKRLQAGRLQAGRLQAGRLQARRGAP